MQLLALVLAISAFVIALVPTMGESQMVGVALSLLAMVLALMTGQRARSRGRRATLARAARWLATGSLVLSLAMFATCQGCKGAALDQIERQATAGTRP